MFQLVKKNRTRPVRLASQNLMAASVVLIIIVLAVIVTRVTDVRIDQQKVIKASLLIATFDLQPNLVAGFALFPLCTEEHSWLEQC